MLVPEVRSDFPAAAPIVPDLKPKFCISFPMNFSGEPSASVSGHLRRPPQKPPPPQGRSHHPLHRHVLRLANPQLFHRFPNPSSSFPVRSTMAGHVLLRSPADSALAAPPSAPTPRPHLTAAPGRAHRKPDAIRALRARARPGSRRRLLRPPGRHPVRPLLGPAGGTAPPPAGQQAPRPRSLPLCQLSSTPLR